MTHRMILLPLALVWVGLFSGGCYTTLATVRRVEATPVVQDEEWYEDDAVAAVDTLDEEYMDLENEDATWVEDDPWDTHVWVHLGNDPYWGYWDYDYYWYWHPWYTHYTWSPWWYPHGCIYWGWRWTSYDVWAHAPYMHHYYTFNETRNFNRRTFDRRGSGVSSGRDFVSRTASSLTSDRRSSLGRRTVSRDGGLVATSQSTGRLSKTTGEATAVTHGITRTRDNTTSTGRISKSEGSTTRSVSRARTTDSTSKSRSAASSSSRRSRVTRSSSNKTSSSKATASQNASRSRSRSTAGSKTKSSVSKSSSSSKSSSRASSGTRSVSSSSSRSRSSSVGSSSSGRSSGSRSSSGSSRSSSGSSRSSSSSGSSRRR